MNYTGYTIVWLNIEKVMNAVSQERGTKLDIHSPTGGSNANKNRIERAKKHWKSGGFMDPPKITFAYDFELGDVSPKAGISIDNGRHRIVVAYQSGEKKIPFSVPKEQASEMKKLYS